MVCNDWLYVKFDLYYGFLSLRAVFSNFLERHRACGLDLQKAVNNNFAD